MTHKNANDSNDKLDCNDNNGHDALNKVTKKKQKWMNPKARGCCAYAPTILEHYANIITHAVIKYNTSLLKNFNELSIS
jgi:hypothetical protein